MEALISISKTNKKWSGKTQQKLPKTIKKTNKIVFLEDIKVTEKLTVNGY